MKVDSIWAELSTRIPEEYKTQVMATVDRTYRVLSIDPVDMDYLFHIYNNFVNHYEPERRNCPACRTKVVGKMRQIVNYWRDGNQ
jgi:ribosomal protein S15P/S13E